MEKYTFFTSNAIVAVLIKSDSNQAMFCIGHGTKYSNEKDPINVGQPLLFMFYVALTECCWLCLVLCSNIACSLLTYLTSRYVLWMPFVWDSTTSIASTSGVCHLCRASTLSKLCERLQRWLLCRHLVNRHQPTRARCHLRCSSTVTTVQHVFSLCLLCSWQ